ncbi:DUF354 domain-containing protein [bacterium]|nr:DUF354 domain-containing protein [bacterium]
MISSNRKIWIDLDNSPHVPFFIPIIEELKRHGCIVTVTARDCFQVCGLADLHKMSYLKIGRHYGKNKLLKVLGLMIRAMKMAPTVIKGKPILALSHGSRSQQILSNILGIPVVAIGDYEYAKSLPFFHWDYFIIPDVIPDNAITNYNCDIFKYPGIKEDIYVPSFNPEPGLLEKLGISEEEIVVTIRPPAKEAHYHNPKSDVLFHATIDWLKGANKLRMVILPRNEQQGDSIINTWPSLINERKIVIPDKVVNGLNLIWHSDLVISGGGTMNREAAALGIPVYSIFRGEIGAVDRFLSDSRRLVLLESPEDLKTKVILKKWDRTTSPDRVNRPALRVIVAKILELLENSLNRQL